MATLTAGCSRLELPWAKGSASATPSPTPEVLASPTPVEEEPQPADMGAAGVEGRLYLRDTAPGAVIYYDPWVDYESVQKVKEAYAFARDLLTQELNIADVAPVTVYLAQENQFRQFAQVNEFAHPAYLAGFYSYLVRDGQAVDAKVYLNAQAQGFVLNIAHEITHVATPWLPTWVGEGVAEYIRSRAGLALQDQAEPGRILSSRQMVRAALKGGAMMDGKGLESFDWAAAEDYRALEVAYAQSWQLMEYIAQRYAPDGLAKLVAVYRTGQQEGVVAFLLALGVPTDTAWSEFSVDIVDSLTPEEQVGQSLCGLRLLASQGDAITRDLNQFVAQSNPGQSENPRDTLLGFGERWDSLAQQTAGLAAPGPALTVRDLWSLYFQSMVQAMQEFAQGSDASANRRITIANQQYLLAVVALRDALTQRSWLACD